MSMSSIPHDQSNTHNTGHALKAAASWVWALLAVSVLILLLVIGWQTAHLKHERSAETQATLAVQTHSAEPSPAILNMDAEPTSGNPMPKYPADVLEAGIEGDVIARLQIDSTGQVTDAIIVSREGQRDVRLDQAALDALLQWRFRPALREGKAIASVVQVPVEFRTGR